jgi:putative ABC transport system ATP-binding protein
MTRETLRLVEVTKGYSDGPAEVRALSGVNVAVAAGEVVAVRGPSGSGKSTLIHLAAGLEAPNEGSIELEGRTMPSAPGHRAWAEARRRRIGVVFQRLNLMSSLTALENVALPLELDGHRRGPARAAARSALAAAGLPGDSSRFPDDLSGGQQQRVAIARAVVGERRLLLADEPTGALDSVTAEHVVELLAAQARAGAAVLLVTHDSRVASWADRVVSLRDGRVMDGASPSPQLIGADRREHQ